VFKSCCRNGSGLLLHTKKTYTHKAKHLMADLIIFVLCILFVIINKHQHIHIVTELHINMFQR